MQASFGMEQTRNLRTWILNQCPFLEYFTNEKIKRRPNRKKKILICDLIDGFHNSMIVYHTINK